MNASVKRFYLIAGLLLCTALSSTAQISIKFDSFPFQNFSKPIEGLENAEVSSNATTIGVAHTFTLKPQRTELEIGLSWERREFSYRGFSGEAPDIDALHSAELSFTLTHAISEKWSLMAIVTPGLASDLHGDVTKDDFNFQTVIAGIRRVNSRFAYGFGAVYSTQFGEPIPLPVLLFDWNNGGKLSWLTILPVSSELWYAHSDRFHIGMVMGVSGNKYQGDPERYDVDDPELQYSVITVGPSARVALGGGTLLQIEGGVVPYHKFEFFDGSKEEESFNLKSSAFMRFGLQVGI